MIRPGPRRWRAVPVATVLALVATTAFASALEVTPILSDVVAAADGATSLVLRNRGTAPATVQLRLMRWASDGDRDVLTPAEGIAASPPFATIQPGATHVIRIVRLSKRPIVGEEAYRLLLDELPQPNEAQGAIALNVRHALPVFFRSPAAAPAQVRWSVIAAGDGRDLVAANAGERRLRVSALRLDDAAGRSVGFGTGLAGYVLGGQTHRWHLPPDQPLSGRVSVSFDSETGPTRVEAGDAPHPRG